MVTPHPSSPDSDYSPGLSQVLVMQEGVFRNTCSRIAIPYYDQPSTSRGVTSPGAMRHMFQWSDDEPEYNGYTSFDTVSSIQRNVVSVNMVDNDGNDTDLHCHMQAQEEAIKNQQTALDGIQRLLG